MKKNQQFRMQAIQKEQVQLVQIEKTLETLLADIKDSINTMKVEELQLKSSLVEHFTNLNYVQDEKPTTSAQAAAADVSTITLLWVNDEKVPEEQAATGALIDESINKQLLDLETLLVPMKQRIFSDDEEEEEDDDEMDENDGGDEEEINDEEFLPEYH